MKLGHLKVVRVAVSLVFFIATMLVFFDISHNIPTRITSTVLFLQFVPSLLKFMTLPTIAISGFVVVMILTILFGRVYCSTICPLGTLQDIITFISKKTKRKFKFKFELPYNKLRYFLLIATISLLVSDILFAVILLDPYSNFGRIFSSLLRPCLILANNSLAWSLEKMDLFWMTKIDFKGWSPAVFVYGVVILLTILWLSIKHGRLYCNTICPVGTFLGLISKFSIFKIDINQSNCTSCGLCLNSCKAECIDMEKLKVDNSRCVACFNCFKSCRLDGFSYKFILDRPVSNKYKNITNKSKRNFMAELTGVGTLLLLPSACTPLKDKRYKQRFQLTTPPGSICLQNFTNNCTACHICVASCPTQVLQPSFLGYGISGIFQPRMDFHKSFCNYECTVCGEVCPSGAILPLKKEKKIYTQTGKVKFIKEECIVETKKTDCGACSEHCPTKATHMVPYGKLVIPEVNNEICIGCGACEFACPTKPHKAIFVEANKVHQIAKKPVSKKAVEQYKKDEDFPF